MRLDDIEADDVDCDGDADVDTGRSPLCAIDGSVERAAIAMSTEWLNSRAGDCRRSRSGRCFGTKGDTEGDTDVNVDGDADVNGDADVDTGCSPLCAIVGAVSRCFIAISTEWLKTRTGERRMTAASMSAHVASGVGGLLWTTTL